MGLIDQAGFSFGFDHAWSRLGRVWVESIWIRLGEFDGLKN